mmetsp:Transcript_35518/g.82005  ORF Transcript_35518/g.82005 Transcript_35518/m.82005 type:complete len:274 (+) Transcript_35518:632-1453(+)
MCSDSGGGLPEAGPRHKVDAGLLAWRGVWTLRSGRHQAHVHGSTFQTVGEICAQQRRQDHEEALRHCACLARVSEKSEAEVCSCILDLHAASRDKQAELRPGVACRLHCLRPRSHSRQGRADGGVGELRSHCPGVSQWAEKESIRDAAGRHQRQLLHLRVRTRREVHGKGRFGQTSVGGGAGAHPHGASVAGWCPCCQISEKGTGGSRLQGRPQPLGRALGRPLRGTPGRRDSAESKRKLCRLRGRGGSSERRRPGCSFELLFLHVPLWCFRL